VTRLCSRQETGRGNAVTVESKEDEGLFSTLPIASWKTPVLPASPTFPPPSTASIVFVSIVKEQRSLPGVLSGV
jgi:hypothetical protein